MKPRVAFFDFASCEGCQLQVVNLEEAVIDLVSIVDVVSFREAMKEHSDNYDIAIIEGSIARPMDEERLKGIRSKAKLLVAFGACACTGGVNAMRNRMSADEARKIVYGDAAIKNNPYFDVFPVKAVNEVVKVDAYIPGCPINRDEFCKIVTALALGKKPELPNYPVCVECKRNGNICVFELGKFCLGPVSRAGCGAICPTNVSNCEGCRGLLDNPNTDSELEVLQKYGLTLKDALGRFQLFCAKAEVAR